MKSKQTAVEWLLENLISEPYSEVDFKYNAECWNKAKAIEKEQIMRSHISGYNSGLENKLVLSYEYYIKTFKSEL